MPRQRADAGQHADKVRLLRRTLDFQAHLVLAAEERGDGDGMYAIERRMHHVDALLAELETREKD